MCTAVRIVQIRTYRIISALCNFEKKKKREVINPFTTIHALFVQKRLLLIFSASDVSSMSVLTEENNLQFG